MKLIAHEKNVTERDIQIAYNKKKRKMRNGEKIKEQRIYSGRPTKRQKEQIRKLVGRTKSLGEMKERKE